LALTISFSRSDRARTDPIGVGAGLSRRTVPDVLQLLESLLRTPEGLGAYPAGRSPYQVRKRGSTRSGTKKPNPGRHLGPTAPSDGTGTPGLGRGYSTGRLTRGFPPPTPPPTPPSPPSPRPPTPLVACGEPLRPSARHPVSGVRVSTGFPPPLCAIRAAERACAACGRPRSTASTLRAYQAFCTSAVASP
jgi:hypothetical protein